MFRGVVPAGAQRRAVMFAATATARGEARGMLPARRAVRQGAYVKYARNVKRRQGARQASARYERKSVVRRARYGVLQVTCKRRCYVTRC